MKRVVPVAVAALLVPCVIPLLASGCGTESSSRSHASDRPAKRRRAPKEGTFESSNGARQMAVQNEVGVYDHADVEQAMEEHFGEVRGCYARAGRAQRYASGTVTLRFLVRGDGTPTDVHVISTELGNYEVERCLVELGRDIKFPPPQGRKATSFEYPVEFRSTQEMKVVDVDDTLRAERDVPKLMRALADCGTVAEGGASALLYIDPSGGVGSAGMAADRPLDEEVGGCMVKAMRRWRTSASQPGRMLRWRVRIPEVIAVAAEPPPYARAGALNASGRKKRR